MPRSACSIASKADLIDRACEEIKDGQLHDQFIVDIMQGGAGTSTNMNVNEVIANRGLELAGHAKGDYQHLDPNDHVNCSQSTNDSYPTALKIGLCLSIERLLAELEQLVQAFRDKGREFAGILKVGRTQLQDAVPMTLEQEFEGFAVTLAEDHASFESVMKRLWETNLGRHRDRDGHRRRPALRRRRSRASRRDHGLRHRDRAEPGRSDDRCRRLHGTVGHAQALRDEAVEDLQRSAAAQSPARRRASARSTCRRGRRDRASCRARSTRSSRRLVNEVAFAVAGNDVTLGDGR